MRGTRSLSTIGHRYLGRPFSLGDFDAPGRHFSLRSLFLLGLAMSVWGCELDEVTLAQPEDIPVVEAYIMVGDGQDQVSAFLHWTQGDRPARDLHGLGVTLKMEDGTDVPLFPEEITECLRPGLEDEVEGVCFSLSFGADGFFLPGTRVEMEIVLEDGGTLRSGTTIPEAIDLIEPSAGNRCALPPGNNLELSWTRSPGVWAYSAETEIMNLKTALAAEGITVETDSVALLGLAVTDADTTIVFPKEFGVFDRFDLEEELAAALQAGLPRGATARVIIAAVDQNYVNWVRGGNFNPSGQVRVSSIRGPGVGVFGSVFRRAIVVLGAEPIYLPGAVLPSCLPGQNP